MKDEMLRPAAVAGSFYPAGARELSQLVESFLAEVDGEARPARAGVAPHAGLIYSGQCAAHVFKRLEIPAIAVILAPNHTGRVGAPGGASLWGRGAFQTPLGDVAVAQAFASELEHRSALVAHDPIAHRQEHAIEVELPFISTLAPHTAIVPIVLAFDDWKSCSQLAADLATLVAEWPEEVLLIASSDMTHYESAANAERKDSIALAAIERLNGEELLAACRREHITMCGRGPAAVVVEAARQMGAKQAQVVDYRHSGWVTRDDSSVVAYAGVLIA